jgi:Holliday junction resolvasome RuvABC endonuclease subunit
MIVIGIDLSLLSTGICILQGDSNASPVVNTFLVEQVQVKGEKAELDRLVSICSRIIRVVKDHPPNLVVIEAPAMNQVWQMARIGGLHYCVRMQLYLACGIVPSVEQATKLRSHVVGSISFKVDQVLDAKGKAKKKRDYGKIAGKNGKMRPATVKDVIGMRLKDQGLTFQSQDEMDAYVCARFGWDQLAGGS